VNLVLLLLPYINIVSFSSLQWWTAHSSVFIFLKWKHNNHHEAFKAILELHMMRWRTYSKHKRTEAERWSDTQHAKLAGQTVSALPSLTWERRGAGRRALCRGGSGGRLLLICHLHPYLHKHTQRHTVRDSEGLVVRQVSVGNTVYTAVTCEIKFVFSICTMSDV